jgi:hypothetical protein
VPFFYQVADREDVTGNTLLLIDVAGRRSSGERLRF